MKVEKLLTLYNRGYQWAESVSGWVFVELTEEAYELLEKYVEARRWDANLFGRLLGWPAREDPRNKSGALNCPWASHPASGGDNFEPQWELVVGRITRKEVEELKKGIKLINCGLVRE